MTFLELCQDVRREAGISGSGPSSVTGQIGEMDRIVNWVKRAWNDVQNMRTNWMWMRGYFTFNTTSGDHDYSPAEAGIASRFSMWGETSLRIYRTSSGLGNEFYLPMLSYEEYRRIYLTNTRVTGTPVCFAIAPDMKLLLGPWPDDTYTITGEYWKSPQTLSADADEPELPEQFHSIIVWKALEHYGFFESAPDVLARAQKELRFYRNRLEMNQLPDIEMAAPLV